MQQTTQEGRRRRRAFTPVFKAEVVGLCRKGERSMGAAPLEGERGRGCWGSAESNHQMLIGQQAFGSNR